MSKKNAILADINQIPLRYHQDWVAIVKNRAIKISVSIPLSLLEELDKLTTYKGRSRSKYISNSIRASLNGAEHAEELSDRQIYALLRTRTDDPLIKAICDIKLGFELIVNTE